MQQKDPLYSVLAYIMNHAGHRELDAIEQAIQRKRQEDPRHMGDLNIEGMVQHFSKQLGSADQVDIKGMVKRLITDMILEQQPDIPPEHLAELVEHYLPDRSKPAGGREEKVPRDILMTMLDQFIRYSTGRMTDRELKELKEADPDWVERYWDVFSENTQTHLADLIRGKINTKQFWASVAV